MKRINLGYNEKLSIISSLQREIKKKSSIILQQNNKIKEQEITIKRLMNQKETVRIKINKG